MKEGNLRERILKETEKFPGKTAVLYKEYGKGGSLIDINGEFGTGLLLCISCWLRNCYQPLFNPYSYDPIDNLSNYAD